MNGGGVLCAFMKLGMAGERGFPRLFGSGVVPGWFLDAKCGKVQYCLMSVILCVHLQTRYFSGKLKGLIVKMCS